MKNKHAKLILIEEIFNSITHGLGCLASIIGFIFLFLNLHQRTPLHIVGLLIFCLSLFLMYLFSTLFHSLTYTKAQKIFLIFDRSAIFLLIAGTMTPVVLTVANNPYGWSLLVFVWMLAITGIILNAVFPNKYPLAYVPVYLLMGWIGTTMVGPLSAHATMVSVWLLFAGGIFYSLGTIFYAWNKLPFNHTIWHLFVIVGSVCHFLIMPKL